MTTDRATIETKPLIAIREFFANGSRPVAMTEMSEFWKACSDAEKAELKASLLNWDGNSHFVPAAA